MKRFIAAILTFAVVLCAFIMPAFAATKSDLLNEAAKIPVYKYVKVAVENAARNIEITSEQADALMPLIKEAAQILNKDNGSSYYSKDGKYLYTETQYKAIMDIINKACGILGFTYTVTPAAQQLHKNDIVFKVFDKSGKLIFTFDGDMVTDTSSVSSYDNTAWIALGTAASMCVLAGAAFVIAKRKIAA